MAEQMQDRMSPTAVQPPHRFSSGEVRTMLEAGVFHEDDRIELLDGQLVATSPIGDAHVACVNRLCRCLDAAILAKSREDLLVSVQNPVRLDAYNEPEPDIALTTCWDGAPGPDEVLLVIEVAESSVAHDRDVKLPRYAEAGIPEVWIVNLADGHVDAYREPQATDYRTRHRHRDGDALPIPGLDEASIRVRSFLPPPESEDPA